MGKIPHLIMLPYRSFLSNSVTHTRHNFSNSIKKKPSLCISFQILFCPQLKKENKTNRPRVFTFFLLLNFSEKLKPQQFLLIFFVSISFSFFQMPHFQFRLSTLLVLIDVTFRLSHKKCCSYFKCCDREREFGSVVPFK